MVKFGVLEKCAIHVPINDHDHVLDLCGGNESVPVGIREFGVMTLVPKIVITNKLLSSNKLRGAGRLF